MQDTRIYTRGKRERETRERNEDVTTSMMIVRDGDMNIMKMERIGCIMMDDAMMETVPNGMSS
jgi:hypothetical protein